MAPLNLSMMVTANAKGVKPATAEGCDEVRSIGEAAAQTAAETKMLAAANDEAVRAYRAATAAAQGQTAAERELRAAIDQRLGIGRNVARIGDPFDGNATRAADIEAYGQKLDALRAKYNPLYAEVSRYKMMQAEIREAHRLGAISADEMTAALDRERTAALQTIGALKGRGAAMNDNFALGGNRFHSTNLMFQAQDIAMMSLMGQAPMAVGLQQGMQVAGIFQQMGGGTNAVRALGAAFGALINPVTLATVGITAAGAAAVQYFMSAGEEARTLDDILEEHEANIRRLGPAYEAIHKRQMQFATDSIEVVELLNEALRENVLAKVEDETAAALKGVMSSFINEIGLEVTTVEERFQPFIQIIGRLQQSIAEGTPDFQRFNSEIATLTAARPELEGAGRELITMFTDAQAAASALPNVGKDIDAVGLAFGRVNEAIARFDPYDLGGRYSDIEEELATLQKRAVSGELSIDDLNDSIDAMSRMNPDLSAAIGEIGRLIRALAEARRQADRLANTTPKTHRLGAMDALAEDFDRQLNLALRMGDLGETLGVGKVDKDATSAANAYRDLVKSARDRIAQLKTEIDLVGKAGAEAERLRFEQQLLADAFDKGRSIGREQRREIAAMAEEYGRLTEALSKAQLAEDLMFEREQIFRSPVDREIADMLRSAGLEVDLDGYHAGLARVNIELRRTQQLHLELIDGGISDLRRALRDGRLEWEELGDIAVNALDRIIAKLQDDLMNALSGLSGGRGGSILSWIGRLFGFGGGSSRLNYFPPPPSIGVGLFHDGRYPGQPGGSRDADPAWFIGAPRYHAGRIPGLAPDEEAAIVRRDEPIFRSMEHARQVVGAMNDNGGGRLTTVRLIVEAQEGPMLRPTIRAEADDAAVQVVTEYHRSRENLRENGGAG
jgi:hypothetical protein